MLIPDFYEILDLVDDSLPHRAVDGDLDLNDSGKLSSHSKDSGRNSSTASSRGTVHSFTTLCLGFFGMDNINQVIKGQIYKAIIGK